MRRIRFDPSGDHRYSDGTPVPVDVIARHGETLAQQQSLALDPICAELSPGKNRVDRARYEALARVIFADSPRRRALALRSHRFRIGGITVEVQL